MMPTTVRRGRFTGRPSRRAAGLAALALLLPWQILDSQEPAPVAGPILEAEPIPDAYGSCPDELDGPEGRTGVAWGDTLAALDSLRASASRDGAGSGTVDGSLVVAAEDAYRHGDHTVAYAGFAAAARSGGGYPVLWRAARAAVDVGQDLSGDRADAWYRLAESWGRRAVEAAPDRPEGHLQLAQALGLIALDAGVRERVRYSNEIRAEARATIEADSGYAGGWHVLARWNAEVMSLSGPARFFARNFLGGEVMSEASWEQAERYMARAATLEPLRIVHHLELGKILMRREVSAEARDALRRVLELPPWDYHDCVYRQEAREALAEIGEGG